MKNKSFTLIEVLLSLFLIANGALGAFALLQRNLAFSSITSARLQASYLCQEGIEIIKNIRDTNWLERKNWSEGLGAGDWEADYNDQALTSFANRYLKTDGGFYNYDSGSNTKFIRKITISPDGPDILKILVEVSWQERGRSHQVSAQANLYNWRK